MRADEEKRGLLVVAAAEEQQQQRVSNGMRDKIRGRKRSAVVMGVCFTAVAVATLLVVTTMHGLCGRKQQQHVDHHISDALFVPSSPLAEPSEASAITVDDGRYVSAGQDNDTSFDEKLFKKAGILQKRQSATASVNATSTTTTSSATATGTVLVDFQVHQPVLTPEGATLDSGKSNGEAGDVQDSCQVVLMDHVFAYSYGEPYIGEFCPCVIFFSKRARRGYQY